MQPQTQLEQDRLVEQKVHGGRLLRHALAVGAEMDRKSRGSLAETNSIEQKER